MDESWFLPLSMNQRGFILQLILEAKKQDDNGYIRFRSVRAMAQRVGGDRSTVAQCVSKFQQLGVIQVVEKSATPLTLFLPKYKKWQDLRFYKDRSGGSTVAEKSATVDGNGNGDGEIDILNNTGEDRSVLHRAGQSDNPPRSVKSKNSPRPVNPEIDPVLEWKEWLGLINQEQIRKWGKVRMDAIEVKKLVKRFGAEDALILAIRESDSNVGHAFNYLNALFEKWPDKVESYRQRAAGEVKPPPALEAYYQARSEAANNITHGIGKEI